MQNRGGILFRSKVGSNGNRAVVADAQDIAAAFSKDRVNGSLICIEQVQRNKRLDGAGKAAALETPCAALAQHTLADCQRQRHTLILRGFEAVCILVEFKAGMASLQNQLEEAVKLILLDCIAQLGGTAAVIEEMDGTDNGTVAGRLADIGNCLEEFLLVHLAQDLFAEICGDGFHLTADGCIVIGQVGMAALGVTDTQCIPLSRKVKVHLIDDGIGGVLEINGDGAAHGAGL